MSSPSLMVENNSLQAHDKWQRPEDVIITSGGELDPEVSNGVLSQDNVETNGPQDLAHPHDDFRGDAHHSVTGSSQGLTYREKQVKPNKVYIGGLPEHTRQEDLQSCFGKIGNIVNIELKLGYGFVEFDTKEAADESVAKYHEGFFMGNKIRVEISRGGGKTAKYSGEPGACFKCGNMGHWARECPNPVLLATGEHRRPGYAHGGSDLAVADRLPHGSRDYPLPPPRDSSFRDEHGPGRYVSSRDARYGYEYPPPPSSRDYRRPISPTPRDYRDYGPSREYVPPRSARDFDDYRARAAPPPPPPPPTRGYYPPEPASGYSSRAYDVPRDYDRGPDRKAAVPPERYPPYVSSAPRPRTPPGPPPRSREEYDRAPPREFPPAEYRGRPVTPPLPPSRYGEYPRASGGDPAGRYRRRSQSPPGRPGTTAYRYANEPNLEPAGYSSGNIALPPTSYSGNGYAVGTSGSGLARSGGNVRERDYVPRASGDSSGGGGYSRRG